MEKNPSVINREKAKSLIIMAVKKILKIENHNIDLKSLKANYKGSYRIKKGDIRIIFTLIRNKIITIVVRVIDFRGPAYN